MCGIAGEIAFSNAELPAKEHLKRAQEYLTKRGPDENGFWEDKNLRFAHTRLKIFDLTDASAQPMHDKELGLHITFNGAIYNYQELREELREHGYSFFSTGDTEVILKAYHAWGEKALQRFQGMFAFVIYSEKTGCIFAARDRLGIKPFYYSKNDKHFLFASTMPALLKRGDLKLSLNKAGLHSYMSLHAITPLNQTIFNEVEKLAPAHYLNLDFNGKMEIKEYWNVRDIKVNKDISWDEAKEGLKEKLFLAAKRRMVVQLLKSFY